MENPLVLALLCAGFAAGLLSGIWLGFRVVTRDAALLGVLDKRVAQALTVSSEAQARAAMVEAEWEEHLAELERKRAKARAERQRAEQTEAKATAAAMNGAAEPPAELTGRDRRRMLARRMNA